MPSQRIFLLRHLSQAWAIRLCELVPTLMTFMGRIPGILAVFLSPFLLHVCCIRTVAFGMTIEYAGGIEGTWLCGVVYVLCECKADAEAMRIQQPASVVLTP